MRYGLFRNDALRLSRLKLGGFTEVLDVTNYMAGFYFQYYEQR